MSKLPRERNAQETQKRLLDAAEEAFAAKGFAGARLHDIAKRADAQQALIHHYFSDKVGLYRAVIDRAVEKTTMDSWELLAQDSPLPQMLDGFVDLLVRFYGDNKSVISILAREAESGDSVFVDVMRERTGPLFRALMERVTTWQEAGIIRKDLPAHELLVATLALAVFPYQEAALVSVLLPGVPAPTVAEKKRAVVTLLLTGALAR